MADLSDTRPPRPPGSPVKEKDWYNFRSLLPFVDVVYGATLSYIFVQIADGCRVLFHPRGGAVHEQQPGEVGPLIQVGLATLALNYLLQDYAEARLVTERYPYQGHQRFLIDLLIAALFLLVFTGAQEASAYLFVPFGLVFLCGAWWALVVEKEAGKEALYPYPQFTVGTHVAAFFACWVYAYWRWRIGAVLLHSRDVLAIWGGYAVWACVVMYYRSRLNLPAADVDMLPIGIAGRTCARCWRGLTSMERSFLDWTRRPAVASAADQGQEGGDDN